MLEMLLQDVAQYEEALRTTPPSSPPTSATKLERTVSPVELEKPVQRCEEIDDYGFDYDDEEEDVADLSLMRLPSRAVR